MKREELESYLGKKVEVTLSDGDVTQGYLRKTQDEAFKNNPNLYLPKNYYFTTASEHTLSENSVLFRSSDVKKIRGI